MKQTWRQNSIKVLALFLFALLIGGCTPTSYSLEKTKSPSNQLTTDQEEVGNEVLPQGTKVDDLDLSGTTTLEAQTKINDWSRDTWKKRAYCCTMKKKFQLL